MVIFGSVSESVLEFKLFFSIEDVLEASLVAVETLVVAEPPLRLNTPLESVRC